MAKKRKAGLKKNSSQFNQIHGHQNSTTLADTTGVILLAIMMIPLPVCGIASLHQSMAMIAQNPDLWIVPSMVVAFGVFLTGLYFYVIWWVGVWVPGVTFSSFVLRGDLLEIRTRKHGATIIRVGDIITCKKRMKRSFHGTETVFGWWLRSRTIGWVYLDGRTSNSRDLISRITSASST
jgi:hypothetical protein